MILIEKEFRSYLAGTTDRSNLYVEHTHGNSCTAPIGGGINKLADDANFYVPITIKLDSRLAVHPIGLIFSMGYISQDDGNCHDWYLGLTNDDNFKQNITEVKYSDNHDRRLNWHYFSNDLASVAPKGLDFTINLIKQTKFIRETYLSNTFKLIITTTK